MTIQHTAWPLSPLRVDVYTDAAGDGWRVRVTTVGMLLSHGFELSTVSERFDSWPTLGQQAATLSSAVSRFKSFVHGKLTP